MRAHVLVLAVLDGVVDDAQQLADAELVVQVQGVVLDQAVLVDDPRQRRRQSPVSLGEPRAVRVHQTPRVRVHEPADTARRGGLDEARPGLLRGRVVRGNAGGESPV